MLDGEGLEPRFSRSWIGVTETVWERRSTSFYLSKDTFDHVPISVFLVSKSEPASAECCLEMSCAIDEKHSVLDVMFLAQFT